LTPQLPAEAPPHGGHKIQLDGLRALAAMGVIFEHTLPRQFADLFLLGNAGVRLFFVLSGFLITGILLDAKERVEESREGFGRALVTFYARRALRIFPLYYFVVLSLAAAGITGAATYLPYLLTYTANVAEAQGHDLGSIAHFWSLAVEEQFYLIWPAVVLLTPRRALPLVFISTVLAAPLWRFGIMIFTRNDNFASLMMPSCLDTLGAGALMAFAWRGSPATQARYERFARFGLWLGLALYLAVIMPLRLSRAGFIVSIALRDVSYFLMFSWVVHRAARGFTGVAGRFLASGPLVYLGMISYGIYVYHPLVVPVGRYLSERFAIDLAVPSGRGLHDFVYVTAVTLAVASFSWYAFEGPLNGLKRYFPYTSRHQPPPRASGQPGVDSGPDGATFPPD
jgi:peptidoglycan/LPS O-acetylase OafA/YrhL